MTQQNHGQANTQNESDAKSKRGELIRIGITDLLWFALDLYFLAPLSHVAALWIGILFVAGQLAFSSLIRSTTRRWGTVAALIVIAGIIQPFLPPNETEFHGWLAPANDLMPKENACSASIPVDAVAIMLGDSGVWTTGSALRVVKACNHDLLSLSRKNQRLAITATIFDGKILAQIVNNEFFLNPNNLFRMERPDRHTLIVYDQEGDQRLYVRFLNQRAIRILGKLEYPNCPSRLEITEAGIMSTPTQKFMPHVCMAIPMEWKGVIIYI